MRAAVTPEAARCRGGTAAVHVAGVAIAVMALALSACSRGADSDALNGNSVAPHPCPAVGARVAVSAQGVVRLNGAEISPAALAAALRSLAPPPMLVCYYREAAASEAPAAPNVLDAIMSMRLPVMLFEDAAFARGVPVR
jgi:hypothetical protein